MAPAPAVPAAPVGPTTGQAAPTGQSDAGQGYTVQSGDSLWAIAMDHHVDNWQQLYQENLGTVGGNPDLIFPGQHLQLPS